MLTAHRPANVDDALTLRRIISAIEKVSAELPVIFPAHPRTQARLREFGIAPPPQLKIIEPLGYSDFLKLWSNARLVLTDSGGLQEETTALGIPCLTLRDNTERPITIEQGSNRVVGRSPERILAAALEVLSADSVRTARIPELWDGHAAERIIEALLKS